MPEIITIKSNKNNKVKVTYFICLKISGAITK